MGMIPSILCYNRNIFIWGFEPGKPSEYVVELLGLTSHDPRFKNPDQLLPQFYSQIHKHPQA